MSNVIQIKRGKSAPPNGALQPGELGINTTSGVLYVGSKKEDTDECISTFPYAYRLRRGAGIQTTKDQEEGFDPKYGPYVDFRFLNSNGKTRGSIMITDTNRINFNCQEINSQYADRYLLPTPTPSANLEKDNWYDILTSKNTVTVAQGGTGRDILTAGCALIGNGTGQVLLRSINNATTVISIPYGGTTGPSLITANTLAYWNGAYEAESGFPSNLAYCKKGAFGDAATKGVTTSVTENSTNLITSGGVYAKCANYLPLSGGVLTDTLTLPANKHYTQTILGYALNCQNSDIVNANGIWFQNVADSSTEGLHFLNANGTSDKFWTANDDRTWDTLYAKSGELKFHPNRGSFDNLSGYSVFHSGNYTSLFHLPKINIFTGRTLSSSNSTIRVLFEKESNSNTGDTVKSTRQFGQGTFYLFFAGFGKASNDGEEGDYYNFLLVPQSYIPTTNKDFEARNLVISSGKDAKYFSVRYVSETKEMIISNKGYDGEGCKDNTFGMYCIY